MAVAPDVTGTKFDSTTAGTTLSSSSSITVGASATSLVAFLSTSDPTNTNATSAAATWNGVSMTLLASIAYSTSANGNAGTVWIFGLRNPASGAKTLSFSWTGAQQSAACAISFTGSDTTSDANAFPTAHRVTNSGASGTLTLTITSATGNYTVSIGATGTISTPNQTQIYLDANPPDDNGGQRAVGAATVTHTWTNVSNVIWGMAGIDIAAAGGAAAVGGEPHFIGRMRGQTFALPLFLRQNVPNDVQLVITEGGAEPHFVGRTRPNPFELLPTLRQNVPNDVQLVVTESGAEPHFVGITRPTPFTLLVASRQNPASDANFIGPQIEAQPHFVGRTLLNRITLLQSLRQNEARDLQLVITEGGAEPHFVGRFVQQVVELLPLLRQNSASDATFIGPQIEAQPHFVGRLVQQVVESLPLLRQNPASDATFIGPQIEAQPHFVGKTSPNKITLLQSLRQNEARDSQLVITEGGAEPHFVGRLVQQAMKLLPALRQQEARDAVQAAWIRVQGATNDNTANVTSLVVSLGAAVSAHSLVIVTITWGAVTSPTPTVTDDKSNVYHLAQAVYDSGPGQGLALYYAWNITNGPTTFTATLHSSNQNVIIVEEFSGGNNGSDPLDGSNIQIQDPDSSTSADGITSGTFTTTVNTDLIYGAVFSTTQFPDSLGTSFNLGIQTNGASNNNTFLETEYRIQSTASSTTAGTFTQNTAFNNWTTVGVAFKLVSAGIPDVPPHFIGRFVQSTIRLLPTLRQNVPNDAGPLGPQIEAQPHFVGRFVQQAMRLLPGLRQNEPPTIFVAPQPETNVNFVGRTVLQPYYLSIALRQNQPSDTPGPLGPQIEAQPHFVGRFVQQVINLLPLLRQNASADFPVLDVSPHFIGRLSPTVLAQLPLLRSGVGNDVTPQIVDTTASFIGKLSPTKITVSLQLRQNQPSDATFVGQQIEAQPHFIGRLVQQPMRLLLSLRTNPAVDAFLSVVSPFARKLIGQTAAPIKFSAAKPYAVTGQTASHVVGGKPLIVIQGQSARYVIGSTNMKTHDPLDFLCGTAWQEQGPILDANNNPLVLTGATLSWRLDSVDGGTNYITLSLGAGITVVDSVNAIVLVDVPASASLPLGPGVYRDILIVTMPNGDPIPVWGGIIRAGSKPA